MTKKHLFKEAEYQRNAFMAMGFAFATALVLSAFEYASVTYVTALPPIDLTDDLMYESQLDRIEILRPVEETAPEIKRPTKSALPPEIVKVERQPEMLVEVLKPIDKPEGRIPENSVSAGERSLVGAEETPLLYGLSPGDMPHFAHCAHLSGEARQACTDAAMQNFLKDNIRYPEACRSKGIEGSVHVNFTINARGLIENIKVLNADVIDPLLSTEAMRVFRKMPRFEPGRQNGRPVNVVMNMPVTFRMAPR